LAAIESKPLPAPGAQPITGNDRQSLHDAIAKALKNVLSGPQSYYPDGVQEDSQDMGADLDRFMESLGNFKNNYVIDPSDVMGPMVDQLKERVKEFKEFYKDKTSDPMELPLEISPDTRDNRWIEVDPFPGPFSPPKFLNASAPLRTMLAASPITRCLLRIQDFRHVLSTLIQLETVFKTNQRIPCRLRRLWESTAANRCDNGLFLRRSGEIVRIF
jgi:hypothetical protein